MSNPICDYGCGREGIHQFKNGKWCCEKYTARCPKVKAENSKNSKGKPTWNKGGKRSKEWTEKIVAKNTGKRRTKEQKERMRIAAQKCKPYKKTRLGIPHPPEIREKIRRNTPSAKGRKWKLESRQKLSNSLKGKKRGPHSKEHREKISKGNKGKIISLETRRKIRLKKIERAKEKLKNGHQLMPNYNSIGCIILDEYGKTNGYNFQHAENGGEYFIKELGCWSDGYDKDRNTFAEIDEPHHYDINENLLEKDVMRQKDMMEFYKADFIRFKLDWKNNVIRVDEYKYEPDNNLIS